MAERLVNESLKEKFNIREIPKVLKKRTILVGGALKLLKFIPMIVRNKIALDALKSRGIIVSSINELYSKLYVDSMTGVLNRNFLHEKVSKEIYQKDLEGVPVCVVFFDGDNVKHINDNYGHDAADCEIIYLANTITKHLGGENQEENVNPLELGNDTRFVRISGDEFVIVFYNKEPVQVIEKIKRIKHSIHNEALKRKRQKLNRKLDGIENTSIAPPVSFTSSIVVKKNGETIDDITKRLDAIVNNAKAVDRGGIYFEDEKVDGKNLSSFEKYNEIVNMISKNKGENNYFIMCELDYIDMPRDRRGKISSHTINAVKHIDEIIKENFCERCEVYRVDEVRSMIILKDVNRQDFSKLNTLISEVIRLDNELSNKITYSLGGQEMQDKLIPEQIIKSSEEKLKIAQEQNREMIIDRRLIGC